MTWTVEKTEAMMQEIGPHPGIELVAVGEDMVECETIGTTFWVADVSSVISGGSIGVHAYELGDDGDKALCGRVKLGPCTVMQEGVERWRVNTERLERANVPCDECLEALRRNA